MSHTFIFFIENGKMAVATLEPHDFFSQFKIKYHSSNSFGHFYSSTVDSKEDEVFFKLKYLQ